MVTTKPFQCSCTICEEDEICSRENRNCSCLYGVVKGKCGKVPKGCDEWFRRGFTDGAVYTVDPDGKGSFNVRCEMKETIWTVFQKRIDGTVNFNRNWSSYKNGFGNLEKEFWLGLDKIHRLTNDQQRSLRVDLWDFDGNNASALYGSFSIKNETDLYELQVSNFAGSAGDSLKFHNKRKFSTHDKDNDKSDRNCANVFEGGWWFDNCVRSNLNGLYYHTSQTDKDGKGICWMDWKHWSSLKKSEMKLRLSQHH